MTSENTSTVWLVFERVAYEGDYLRGVYSSKELAADYREKLITKLPETRHMEYIITEAKLNEEYQDW